ncbi:MAG: Gfo/Idh/MocA family oxidoreductase, partial [Anaerolineales bacterium]|nr:Gfo/Idh/MocA family oxidoreductase [Anaerolineales bacterium]
LRPEATIIVLRRSQSEPNEAEKLADFVVYNLNDALRHQLDAAIIASPAPFHISIAHELASNGVNLLIEKTLAASFDGVETFLNFCQENKVMVLIGYTLRFNLALQQIKKALSEQLIGRPLYFRAEVGQYLPDWRPQQDYRETVTAQKRLGGGVILELSHELDYAFWLMGPITSVSAIAQKISDLEIDVEDMAEVNLIFESGVFGSVHLDMVQRSTTRKCHIVGSEGTLYWDGLANRAWAEFSDGSSQIIFEKNLSERNDMYLAQMEHFLACLSGQDNPVVTGIDAAHVLKVVLTAKQSSQEGRLISL